MKRKSSDENLYPCKKMYTEDDIINLFKKKNKFLLSILHPQCGDHCYLPAHCINIAAQFNDLETAQWLYENCNYQEKHFIAMEYARGYNNQEFISWLQS